MRCPPHFPRDVSTEKVNGALRVVIYGGNREHPVGITRGCGTNKVWLVFTDLCQPGYLPKCRFPVWRLRVSVRLVDRWLHGREVSMRLG